MNATRHDQSAQHVRRSWQNLVIALEIEDSVPVPCDVIRVHEGQREMQEINVEFRVS